MREIPTNSPFPGLTRTEIVGDDGELERVEYAGHLQEKPVPNHRTAVSKHLRIEVGLLIGLTSLWLWNVWA